MILTPTSAATPPKRARPLSYEDLRRFLFLILSLALGTFLISRLGDVLMLFLVVIFGAMVLNPLVVWLEKKGLRRGLAVLVTLLSLVGILVGAGFVIAPPIAAQVTSLYEKRDEYATSIEKQLNTTFRKYPQLRQALPPSLRDTQKFELDKVVEGLKPNITDYFQRFGKNAGNQVVATLISTIGALFTLVVALLLMAFLLLNPVPLVASLLGAVPARHRDAAGRSFARIEGQMIAWIKATLINGCLTGVQTGILLYLVGLPSALVFGVIAFFGEFVPNIGPLVASLPALFVAAGLGPAKFGLALAAILFVQQVSSNLLVPLVMGREMELHPATIIFFALAMGSLFGIIGAVLAVPFAAIVKVLYDEFYTRPNNTPREELNVKAEKLLRERQWEASAGV